MEEQHITLARWRRELGEARLCLRAGLAREATNWIDHVQAEITLAQIFGLPAAEHPDER